MSNNRYRRIYGETHDSVHIRDDKTNRKIIEVVNELNELNEIIQALYKSVKKDGNKLIRIEEDYEVRWLVVSPEDIEKYDGVADIKTYEEYLDAIRI